MYFIKTLNHVFYKPNQDLGLSLVEKKNYTNTFYIPLKPTCSKKYRIPEMGIPADLLKYEPFVTAQLYLTDQPISIPRV